MTLALELYRSVSRYAAARAVGSRLPGALSGPLAPLQLVNRDEPRLPGPDWVRVRPRLAGICGSDLATLSARSSLYFSPLVSMPFVPGHEIVGEVMDDAAGLAAGTRVVLDPILSCLPRGLAPCDWCASGQTSRCGRVTVGHLSPGLQTGYCADTGGGWSQRLVAHTSQLHPVEEGLSDERAVLAEPLACAVHAVRRSGVQSGDCVLIVGAGTVGLLTLLAVRAHTEADRVVVVAKHPRQAELARTFGATDIVGPQRAMKALRRATRSLLCTPERGTEFLLGGADVAFECAGGKGTLDVALRSVRAGGRVVLSAVPTEGADLTPVWYRELELVGVYASSADRPSAPRHDLDAALELAGQAPLDGFVGARYPLSRWREALDHAFSAGRLGTMKVTFDPTLE